MTEPTDVTITPADFGDVFDDWIGGATLAKKSVDIYGRPDLYAEFEKLDRQLKAELAVRGDDDEPAMDDSVVSDLEQQLVDLYEKWEASKSTWTVRAMPRDAGKAIAREHPDQTAVEPLPEDADETAVAAHQSAVDAFEAQSDARNYAILEQVITRIEFSEGRVIEAVIADDGHTMVRPAITTKQLATMRARLGDWQYIKLIQASKLAASTEPVIPAPFSRTSSRSDQT